MRKNSGSSLFLMELILAILIFAMASTVCVRLFVNAHLLSKNSQEINRGILWAQNLAEIYISPEGSLDKVIEIFPDSASKEGDSVSIYFDENWEPIPIGNTFGAAYVVSLSLKEKQGGLQKAVSIAQKAEGDGAVIFDIPIGKYTGLEDAR